MSEGLDRSWGSSEENILLSGSARTPSVVPTAPSIVAPQLLRFSAVFLLFFFYGVSILKIRCLSICYRNIHLLHYTEMYPGFSPRSGRATNPDNHDMLLYIAKQSYSRGVGASFFSQHTAPLLTGKILYLLR